jgi:ribonuclease HII
MRGRAPGRAREQALRARGFRRVAGLDEVGRGCLAGPVVAAAVVLDPERRVPGLRDSKLLTPGQRETLAARLREEAAAVGLGMADAREIEALDILRATYLAMRRALEALTPMPDFLLIDALTLPGIDLPQEGIVRGDRLCASIAAASIVAKVHRDALMREWHAAWPAYGFDANKGYGTPEHLEALRSHGATPLHRRTFHGVLPGHQLTLPGFDAGSR